MADNLLKLPVARSINNAAIARVGDAIEILGKSLPCTVAAVVSSGIVTVSFAVTAPFPLPQVTIPVGWPEYIRIPVQVGMKGRVIPSDARLGGVSGLGSGQPDLSDPGNLGALAFHPVGSTDWVPAFPNVLTLYGEPDVLVQDKTAASFGFFTSTGITLSSAGHTLTVNSAGVTIDGKVFLDHFHVESGGTGDGGPVG